MKPLSTSIERRNEDILEVLNMAKAKLARLAYQFEMEYDELYQMAAEAALLNYEKAQKTGCPRAFLYGVVRNVLWYKPYEEGTVSLDAPVNTESTACLADLLPAPPLYQVDPKGRMRKTRALYSSLRKLPLEVQEYLVRVHDLNAYQPQRPKKGRFAGKRPNFSRDPGALSRQAYHYLRHDKRLSRLICGTPHQHKANIERDWAEQEGEHAPSTDFERDWA
jgi:hypothetical protein